MLLPSATTRLTAALATVLNPDGSCAVTGFADDARVPTDAERALLEKMPFDGAFLKKRAGIGAFRGDLDDTEAAVAIRTVPTLTVTGVELSLIHI
nr:hypothetical protein [Streptomyces exfoliatus]